jgi:hypothetical protein
VIDSGGIAGVCVAALASELPRKVARLHEHNGWTSDDLPAAEPINAGEPMVGRGAIPTVWNVNSGEVTDKALTSAGTPTIWVVVLTPRLFKTDQVDIDPYGSPVYMNRYSVRFSVWAKAENWERAKIFRNRAALAVRMTLLDWPNMVPGTYGDTGYRLHRNTYTEQFLTPMRMEAGGRVWAPALLSAEIDAEESLRNGSTRDPIGDADTIEPGGYTVGAGLPMTPPPEEEL